MTTDHDSSHLWHDSQVVCRNEIRVISILLQNTAEEIRQREFKPCGDLHLSFQVNPNLFGKNMWFSGQTTVLTETLKLQSPVVTGAQKGI